MAKLDDIDGAVSETVRGLGSEPIPGEVLDALRKKITESETYKNSTPERRAKALEAFEQQVGIYRGVSIREASGKSMATLLERTVKELEPITHGIMGLAQTMDDRPHVFGLGGVFQDLKTAILLLEGVAANLVHMVSCDCGKQEHEEKTPEAKA